MTEDLFANANNKAMPGSDLLPESSLLITLYRNEFSTAWLVRQVECRTGTVMSRMSFQKAETLEGALAPKLAGSLEGVLPVDGSAAVVTDSSYLLELPNVLLSGLRIIAQPVREAVQHATVRYRHLLGSASAVISEKHRPTSMMEDTLEQLSASLLLNLLQPCIDLANVDLEQAKAPAPATLIEARLRQLAANRDEMLFYADMLCRYVSACQKNRAAPVLPQPRAMPVAAEPRALKR